MVQIIESLLDGDRLRMAISANEHCNDLMDILTKPEYFLPSGFSKLNSRPTLYGGSTLLLLYRNLPRPLPERQRRDAEEQCRQVTLTVNPVHGRCRLFRPSYRALVCGRKKNNNTKYEQNVLR